MPTTNVLIQDLLAIQKALLEWFHVHGRDLPWRHTRDPYRVLVSEIMLQQTQVDRVRPKYHAFLETFPTLEALAAAPTAEVIRMWSGLGYNRRAVNLQRTARAVLEEHGGAFPRTVEQLLALPGIGPYTAGAVACFAFEQDVAFMDTNIRRAVRRLFLGPDESSAAVDANETTLLLLARDAVPSGQGWAWNQAIMELGATICTAANPACWRCPLRVYCRAYAARQEADANIFSGEDRVVNARPARRVAERRETPYGGSNRFFRGRTVDALRKLTPGGMIALEDLGPQVKDDYSAEDLTWLQGVVAGLVRDGLAHIDDDGHVGLPH
jgi:A/G-specific adenine glycosylase